MKTVDKENVNTLITILAQIREELGVGHKPMMAELPEEARKVKERTEGNTTVVGIYRIYRRDNLLRLRRSDGVNLAVRDEPAFEKVIGRFFDKHNV